MAFLLGLTTALVAVNRYGAVHRAGHSSDRELANGLAYRVDLNRAGRVELLQLPGVGDSLAQRIEDYRHEHGAFHSVNDLANVQNVGPATLERLRPWVCVQSDRTKDDAGQPVVSSKRVRAGGKNKIASAHKPGSHRKRSKKEDSLTEPIDINHASVTELQKLPWIGPKISQRIVEERRKGPFTSLDDFRRRVSGIGPVKLEAIRPYVILGSKPVHVVTVACKS